MTFTSFIPKEMIVTVGEEAKELNQFLYRFRKRRYDACRESQQELRSFAHFTLPDYSPVMRIDNGQHNSKTLSSASALLVRIWPGPVKTFENVRKVLICDSHPLVAHTYMRLSTLHHDHYRDDCARRRVFDRVLQQDEEQLPKKSLIAGKGHFVPKRSLDPYVLAPGDWSSDAAGLLQYFIQINRFKI